MKFPPHLSRHLYEEARALNISDWWLWQSCKDDAMLQDEMDAVRQLKIRDRLDRYDHKYDHMFEAGERKIREQERE